MICGLDLSLETFGPGSNNAEISPLSAKGNIMEINLESLAKNNNGEKKPLMTKMMASTILDIFEKNQTSNFAFLPTCCSASGFKSCYYGKSHCTDFVVMVC